jgi:hypothetical protein
VTSDLDVVHFFVIREIAYLERISRRYNDLMSHSFQFADDGNEKWHMGSIVEINPNLHSPYCQGRS